MYAASYSKTEAGIRDRAAERLQAERTLRIAAQRDASDARRRLKEIVQRYQAELDANKAALATRTRYQVRFADIERRACKVFKVAPSALKGRRRYKSIVLARQFLAYWAARLTSLSYPTLARLMGGRDHTTIMAARKAYPIKRAAMGRFLKEVR